MVKIGIIGTGFMGKTHFNAYERLSEVDRIHLLTIPEALADAKEFAAASRKTASIEVDASKFFSLEIDAVDICTPTPSHVNLVRRSIECGKAVLCEKPIALSSKAAMELVDQAQRSHVLFMAAQVIRFWPEYRYLMEKVRDSSWGKLRELSLLRYSPMPGWGVNQWFKDIEVSGGALFDLHVHDIDFLKFMLGRARRLSSVGYKRCGIAYTDVTTTLDFGDGLFARAYASYEMPKAVPFRMGYRALFEHAVLDFDSGRKPSLKCYNDEKEVAIDLKDLPDAYHVECEYFVQCLVHGNPPAISCAYSAAQTIELLERIAESADAKGEWREL